jgi:hypothetical protein
MINLRQITDLRGGVPAATQAPPAIGLGCNFQWSKTGLVFTNHRFGPIMADMAIIQLYSDHPSGSVFVPVTGGSSPEILEIEGSELPLTLDITTGGAGAL